MTETDLAKAADSLADHLIGDTDMEAILIIALLVIAGLVGHRLLK